jgi:oligopeptide/dipeptide ABC transporter ATP-binding protein
MSAVSLDSPAVKDLPRRSISVTPLLELAHVGKAFPLRRRFGSRRANVQAVDDVSLAVALGECLGLIGESGCGKTTLGRLALRLIEPTSGTIRFDGTDLSALPRDRLDALRPRVQIVFQDPYSSLNPRKTIEQIVGLPLAVHTSLPRSQRRERVMEALDWVGLTQEHLDRYPHQFSGGQRQRIGIARALITRPALVVCDEPVSALDVSVQAQILELLQRLRQEFGLAYLFISHDIAVVAHLAERIAVMYFGRIVESGPARALIAAPRHPYTKALLSAVPRLHGPPAIQISGDPPSPLDPPSGCAFHTRCPSAMPICRTVRPRLVTDENGHDLACHLHDQTPA